MIKDFAASAAHRWIICVEKRQRLRDRTRLLQFERDRAPRFTNVRSLPLGATMSCSRKA